MKRIVLIFGLLAPFVLAAQVGRFPYQTIRQTYQGDTLVTTIGDTVKQYTNADAYSYNKPLVIRDTSLLELIEKHGGGGATLPGSLNEILLSDGAGGAATNTSIKWDAAEGGLFVSDLSHDTVYLRPNGMYTQDGRQVSSFVLGFHPTTGFYYQSILKSSQDLASLNKAQVRTYANSKHNYVYLEVERNPNYYTRAALDSSGFYLADDFDTTLWGNNHLITKRWALDKFSSGGGSSYVGDEYLNLPGDGEGKNYLDIQLDRDNGGYLDFGWTSTDETTSASFNISSSGLSFSTYHDATDWYHMNFNASDEKHTALFAITTPYGTVGFMPRVNGPLTDNTPTASEISALIGVTPDYLPVGCRVTIKDTDGSGLMYMVESDGIDWYFTVMTKAL